MINAIDFNKLRNAEFIQFSRDVISLINDNDPEQLSVTAQYNVMLQKITEMENLYKNSTQNPITADVEAADFRRDQAINGLMFTINGLTYHYNESWANAAKALQNNLKLYGGGIARENYQSETAILNNITDDWENKTELATAVQTLNLTDWLAELKTANTIFNERYLARTKDYATVTPETLKAKRTETTQAFYELRKFMEAFAVIQASPLYEQTIKQLNALIEQYNTLLAGRHTKKATEKTPEKTSETPIANDTVDTSAPSLN